MTSRQMVMSAFAHIEPIQCPMLTRPQLNKPSTAGKRCKVSGPNRKYRIGHCFVTTIALHIETGSPRFRYQLRYSLTTIFVSQFFATPFTGVNGTHHIAPSTRLIELSMVFVPASSRGKCGLRFEVKYPSFLLYDSPSQLRSALTGYWLGSM